jgi:hypothetical protein
VKALHDDDERVVMRNFKHVFQFPAIPLAMTGFARFASLAGGFVLRGAPSRGRQPSPGTSGNPRN